MNKIAIVLSAVILAVMLTFSACEKHENMLPKAKATFKVTIENVFAPKMFFMTGKTDIIMPGGSESFSFHAGKGHFLSFATMFGQSNDLFYAPDDHGIALYDDMGNALSGDITDMVHLWDAGTEVNQEPGVGPDQAPRQSGPNTGADENGTVKLITDVNDGFTYPPDNEVINVMIENDGGTMFTVTVKNVSDMYGFQTPLAPNVWVIHGDAMPLFTAGEPASAGLEALAEDANNSILGDQLEMETGYVSPVAPGIYVVHDEDVMPVFTDGEMDRGDGLEALAEDANPAVLDASLEGMMGISTHGIFNTAVGATTPGPIMPGQKFEFMFDARKGDHLSFASMLGQSNDLFFSPRDQGIALFENVTPINGNITSKIKLWDAGTEVNQYPGAGNDQAPRQTGPNTGATENGHVMMVNDGFTYPDVSDMIKVTITPMKLNH